MMQDKAQKTEIRSIDTFDNEVSLWNLVGGKSLKFLQKIADVYNELHKDMKPLSILILGETGKTLYSHCFFRGIAISQVAEVPANLLNFSGEFEQYFFTSDPDRGHLIDNFQVLMPPVQSKLLEILRNGEYKHYDRYKKSIELHPVWGPIILTTKNINGATQEILKSVDYVIHINNTKDDIRKIIRMRLQFAGVTCENGVIEMLEKGKSLREIIYIIKMAVVLMVSEGRTCLKMEDLQKLREYF